MNIQTDDQSRAQPRPSPFADADFCPICCRSFKSTGKYEVTSCSDCQVQAHVLCFEQLGLVEGDGTTRCNTCSDDSGPDEALCEICFQAGGFLARLDVEEPESKAESPGSHVSDDLANAPPIRAFYAHLPCIFVCASHMSFDKSHGKILIEQFELIRLRTPRSLPCPLCSEY